MTTKVNENEVLLAITKAKNKARDAMGVGSYEGEAVLRVRYTYNIAPDYVRRVAPAVPWQPLALLLLSKMNETTRRACLREVADLDPQESTYAQIKAAAEAVMDDLMAATTRVVKGSVTGDCEIEVLS